MVSFGLLYNTLMRSAQPLAPPGREKVRKKNPLRQKVERLLTRGVVLVFALVVRILPLRWGRWLGNLFGYLAYALSPRRQHLADCNIALAFGERLSPRERRRIRLCVTKNMCKVFVELFRVAGFDASKICELVPAKGTDKLHRALERGRGAIVVTGHFGNWELLGARLAAEGVNLAVVARDASDAGVAALINWCRQRLGMKVFGRRDVRAMRAHLMSNGVLGILPDQHSRKGSILVDFLGRPAWTVRSPALLALRTGAAILPGFCLRRSDDSLHAIIMDEISTQGLGDRDQATFEVTRRINAVLGQQILAHPDQWLWLHDRWKPAAPEHEEKYSRRLAAGKYDYEE